MTIIVTGGRDYRSKRTVEQILSAFSISKLVHGDQTGADTLAKEWAIANGINQVPYPADFLGLGDAAGPFRNEEMIKNNRDAIVVAFPGNRGTQDCVLKALAYGLNVLMVRSGRG